tara:strand:- start:278 stop:895 length:618 start_codon:yes stop_codon:yes gene_type:complete
MKRLLELFCGTKSVGKVFEKENWEVISVDIEEKWNPTYCCDLLELDYKTLGKFDFIWASVPCVSFSNMGGGHHRNKNLEPLTDTAILGDMLLNKTLEIIDYFKCLWVIENPRGYMRHILKENYTTVNYCKYGSQFFKPTDIFNNFNFIGKTCEYEKKGKIVNCHHQRVSGSHKNRKRGGIQRVSQEEAYKIPEKLIYDLLNDSLR